MGRVTLGNYLLVQEKIISLNRVYAKIIQSGLQGQVSKLWFYTEHGVSDFMWSEMFAIDEWKEGHFRNVV